MIRLELPVLPVGLECRDDAVPQMGRLVLAQLDRPLQPLGQGWVRQVGRADIGGAEIGVAVKQVRLGVQPRAMGVVRDCALRCWAAIRAGRQPSGRLRRGSLSSARAAWLEGLAVKARRSSSRMRTPLHLMNEQRMSTRSAEASSLRSCETRLGSSRVPASRLPERQRRIGPLGLRASRAVPRARRSAGDAAALRAIDRLRNRPLRARAGCD